MFRKPVFSFGKHDKSAASVDSDESNFTINVFPQFDDYFKLLSDDSLEFRRILHGLNILQENKLHIFLVGIENYGQSDIIELLASEPSELPQERTIYNPDHQPYAVYENDFICIWKTCDLGSLIGATEDYCTGDFLANSIKAKIAEKCPDSNSFLIIINFNIKKYGITYEEEFIEALRKNYQEDIDSHIVFLLNISHPTTKEIIERFISKTKQSLCEELSLDTDIVPYCVDDNNLKQKLRAKLLVRTGILYK